MLPALRSSMRAMPCICNARATRVPARGLQAVDQTLLARLVELARGVDADPASIGVLSTGEACAVALLLVRSIYSTAAITRSIS
jgi:hypothetical protein